MFNKLMNKYSNGIKLIQTKNINVFLSVNISNTKSAFTLAEVLITLGIIGVVAAMTMPTLIANNQKTQWTTGARKAYSVAANLVGEIAAAEGSTIPESELFNNIIRDAADGHMNPDGYGNPDELEELIKKHLKVLKVKKTSTITYKFPNYINKDKKLTPIPTWYSDETTIQGLSSFKEKRGYYTQDGMIYYVEMGPGAIKFTVDVNGEKRPNESGRDLFSMVYCRYEGLKPGYWPEAICTKSQGYYPGGHPDDLMKGEDPEAQNPLEYLMGNGWKMDY